MGAELQGTPKEGTEGGGGPQMGRGLEGRKDRGGSAQGDPKKEEPGAQIDPSKSGQRMRG